LARKEGAVTPSAASVAAQGAAVALVLFAAPLLRGLLERYKARLMFRVGPPVLQPYRDLRKWFAKERVRSEHSTWISAATPIGYFIAPLLVAALIPVLTTFPLPFAFMGDMLAGGLILGAGGLLLLLAALDSGSAFSALGVSRIRLVGVFSEPLAFLAVFAAASVAGTTVPFVVNQTLSSPTWLWSATHALLVLAWLLLLIAEAGRIPVDNPTSQQELSMIDPARTFESSGPDLALFEWGGWMKFMVLGIILVNVLASPFGLAPSLNPLDLTLAAAVTFAKLLAAGGVVVTVEAAFAKLRLLRIPEYLTAAVLVAVVAVASAFLVQG
jgi:formate hydrogenlyase subunit 4